MFPCQFDSYHCRPPFFYFFIVSKHISFTLFLFDSRQLLKHHVVAGSIPSSSLQNNGAMQSLLKTPLRVKFYESEDSEWRPLKVNSQVYSTLIFEKKNIFPFFIYFFLLWIFIVVFFHLVRIICGLFSFKSARFYSFPPRLLDRIHDSINKNRKEHNFLLYTSI